MALAQVGLDDKYALERGRVFMTGIQALVRLPMLQRQRDRAAGLNTAGFISGYRGSPLGGLDQALWRAQEASSTRSHIVFQPGRQRGPRRDRGLGHAAGRPVPGRASTTACSRMWYGKGPGVDRCGDVFKHANTAGTSQAWRRAGARRRRPRRQVLDAAAPVRPHLQGRGLIPVLNPVERAGLSSTSACTAGR